MDETVWTPKDIAGNFTLGELFEAAGGRIGLDADGASQVDHLHPPPVGDIAGLLRRQTHSVRRHRQVGQTHLPASGRAPGGEFNADFFEVDLERRGQIFA